MTYTIFRPSPCHHARFATLYSPCKVLNCVAIASILKSFALITPSGNAFVASLVTNWHCCLIPRSFVRTSFAFCTCEGKLREFGSLIASLNFAIGACNFATIAFATDCFCRAAFAASLSAFSCVSFLDSHINGVRALNPLFRYPDLFSTMVGIHVSFCCICCCL